MVLVASSGSLVVDGMGGVVCSSGSFVSGEGHGAVFLNGSSFAGVQECMVPQFPLVGCLSTEDYLAHCHCEPWETVRVVASYPT